MLIVVRANLGTGSLFGVTGSRQNRLAELLCPIDLDRSIALVSLAHSALGTSCAIATLLAVAHVLCATLLFQESPLPKFGELLALSLSPG